MSLYTGEATKPFPLALSEGTEKAIRTIVRDELDKRSVEVGASKG
jgi:hypothetical protein